jgi:chromosome segregation ATPase
MTSGSQTYNAFTDKRAKLERQAREHADTIHTAERQMQAIVHRQGEIWTRLAAIHINANLEVPATVRKSMDLRHDKIEAKKADVERIKTNLSSLKRMRTATAEQRVNIAAALDDAHAAISARFEADPRVVELRRRIAAVTQSFAEAEDKKNRAAAELAEKRVAYEADELFGYLKRRGFGTPAYSVWFPLTRFFDRALARATNFSEEHASYELLNAVPDWVEERIAALGPSRDQANAEFSEVEREFFGGLVQQKQEFDVKESELREIDGSISEENERIAAANKFLSDAAIAEDSELKRIVADFSSILAKKGYYDLKRLAAETKDPEDDALVASLQTLQNEMTALTRGVESEKTELFILERKVKSFEAVESHLRSRGWNASDHSFNGVNADQLSNQLSTDAFTAAVVIGMLSNAHEEPRRNDYGSSHQRGYGGSTGYSETSWSGSSSSSSRDDTPSYTTTDSYGGGNDSYTTTDSY